MEHLFAAQNELCLVLHGADDVGHIDNAHKILPFRYQVAAGSGNTDIFIYPGYKFKIIEALITNFHLPKSTLLMLISALYDREKILEAYEIAVKEKYRFFSYGDACLII